MSNVISTRLLVLGSGPAGYTAAIYAARAGLQPIVVQGIQPGGQLTTTTDVENYPGFRNVIQGPWLMEEMQAQAEHVGTKIVWDHIVEVDFSRRPFVLKGDGGTEYHADALVIATGTGIIVTRAATDARLTHEIIAQITRYPKSLAMVAAALLVALFLPGIPKIPVLVLLGLIGMSLFFALRASRREALSQAPPATREAGLPVRAAAA